MAHALTILLSNPLSPKSATASRDLAVFIILNVHFFFCTCIVNDACLFVVTVGDVCLADIFRCNDV